MDNDAFGEAYLFLLFTTLENFSEPKLVVKLKQQPKVVTCFGLKKI